MAQLTPWQQYQYDLTNNNFSYDANQENAVKKLQDLYKEIIATDYKITFFKKLSQRIFQTKPPQIKGLYLWGGVGRGKTYIMDIFYNALPIKNKLRAHFHHFMHAIHAELKKMAGTQDPLPTIAKQMALKYKIICFDELFVSDITDAMLLGTLFEALFNEGVILVATSNIIPDELYKNGLQRARFLPAIKLINTHCRVYNLDSGIDYRLRTLTQAEIYHYPLDTAADENLNRYFTQLMSDTEIATDDITIDGRNIAIRQQSGGVLMIDFRSLCIGPRSQRDYMEIASLYHSVLLSNVPQMGESKTGDDIARRFLALIDEFYERQVKLIISAAVPVKEIYTDGKLNFEFKRCRSRLIEMQSTEYLALKHLP